MQKLNVLVLGRNKKSVSFVNKEILKYPNLKISKRPEIIISLGGDGTFFYNERKYPGIPKVLVRDDSICNLCSIYNLKNVKRVLENLNQRNFSLLEIRKIEVSCKNKKLTAVNDIVVRNKDQYEAIRFEVKLNNKKMNSIFIGDGIVACTVFGSSGYFNSITNKSLSKGIGIAFNNVPGQNYVTLKQNTIIDFVLVRGRAAVSADNSKKMFILKKEDKIRIKKSTEKAFIVNLW